MVKVANVAQQRERGKNGSSLLPFCNGEERGSQQGGREGCPWGFHNIVQPEKLVRRRHLYKSFVKIFPLVFKEGHTPIQLVCLPRLPAIKITKYALKNLTAGPLLAKYWDSSKLGIFSHSVSI